MEIHVLSPFQSDSDAGPVPECLCAKQRQGHQPQGQTPVHPADSPELTAAPQEAQGKMQCLGSRTHYSQPHTHQEAQAVLQEILRKEVVLVQPLPVTYTAVKGCLLLLNSCSQKLSWGCLGLPNLTGGSPAGKGIPWSLLHHVSWKT